MRLIDYLYFQNLPCLIPVNDVDGDVGEAKIAYINDLIDTVQPEILKEIMGEVLYDEFMEGLEETTIDPKWIAMRNEILNSTAKTSFLTYFVYFEDRRMSSSMATEHGDVNIDVVNMQNAHDFAKNARIWNIGADKANVFGSWLLENAEDYDIYTVGTIDKINRFDL